MFSFLKKESSSSLTPHSSVTLRKEISLLKNDENIAFAAAAEVGGSRGW